jgi:hypothetical protein
MYDCLSRAPHKSHNVLIYNDKTIGMVRRIPQLSTLFMLPIAAKPLLDAIEPRQPQGL